MPPIAKTTTKRFGYHRGGRDRLMSSWFELIGAGSLGLCNAADKFNPRRGTPFAYYARRCIRNECIHVYGHDPRPGEA